MSLAEQILAADDRHKIPVEAWGQRFYIVPMSGKERDAYDVEMHRSKQAGKDMENWRARFLVKCLVDDQGTRIFTDEQAAVLSEKNNEVISRLHRIATSVNETGPDAVEEAAKN